RLRLARLADAALHRPVPRRARAADEADGRGAAAGARHGARAGGALPRLRRPRRGLRDGAGRGDRGGAPTRRRDRLGAREGVRREAGAGRHPLVLGRVGADAVRDRDCELRHLDRPPGHGQGREPRHRRARADRGGLRAGRNGGVRNPMKLVTFDEGRVGRVDGDEIAVLDVPTMQDWFEQGGAAETGERVPLAGAKLRPPIVPKKFFHTAGNFREHEEESKQVGWSHKIAPWIVFFQNVDALVGQDDPVIYPEHLTEELDYELELAVVIGKAGKHFGPEEAADYV